MAGIVNINGKPYTSATEEVALENLKKDALTKTQKALQSALLQARGGDQIRFDVSPITEAIEQAYYLGKENAVK